jgi:hypothetical protein
MLQAAAQWPFSSTAVNGWKCAVCGFYVLAVWNRDRKQWEPESVYWNTERKEMYCCAEHSLKRHEDLQHNKE